MNISKVAGKKTTIRFFLRSKHLRLVQNDQGVSKDNSVEYEYVDVDLCDEDDKQKIHANNPEQSWKPYLSHHDCR